MLRVADEPIYLAAESKLERISPQKIRFTQDTISPNFSNGGSVSDAIRKLRNGEISPDNFPPIRVVEKDGVLYTLDNRRLVTFQSSNIEAISVERLFIDNPNVMSEFAKKFKPIEGGQKIVVTPTAERAAARRILKEFGKYE